MFGQFFILIPLAGIAFVAFAVWNEFARQRKALDVLKVYAEKGVEPPPSVLAVLSRSSSPDGWGSMQANPWARAAFFVILGLGFAALTFWFARGDTHVTWPFVTGFGISSFAMAALAASDAVRALTAPRKNG